MNIHIIEGHAGCEFAKDNDCVAVVVDALRASATAAMLLDAGASAILAVETVAQAFEARELWPDALLFGERGGLPPEGFDYGNSPRSVEAAKNRRVIFTTTTGAGRAVACWGARAVYLGTTVNATAVMRAAMSHGVDVVLIPAGLAGDPAFDAQEDWVAAAFMAMAAGVEVCEGAAPFAVWHDRIKQEGLDVLFGKAPHAGKLRAVGLDEDIAFCAQVDLTAATPLAQSPAGQGLIFRNAGFLLDMGE